IVLIGSSVMTLPMTLLEMDEANFNTDTWLHRKDFTIEALQIGDSSAEPAAGQSAYASSQGAYDLTFTGAMISDSYLMARKYALAHCKRPKWLILGVIPRDIIDTRPAKTLQFSCLSTMQDFKWIKPLYLEKFEDKIEFFLNQFCFFHTHSWWIKGKAE